MTQNIAHKKLGELKKGAKAKIIAINGLSKRFLELGFLRGALVQISHTAPFGGDPIAVKVRGSTIALRRREANHIEVEEV